MSAITCERVRQLLVYDPATGVFTWAAGVEGRGGKRRAGTVAGTTRPDGYVRISLDGKKYEAARVAWLYVTGAWPLGDVDHRDTDPGNNRWANLRDVSHAKNMENRRRPNRQNKTGLLGVCPSPKTPGFFRAQLGVGRRCVWLGDFPTAELAHAAYLAAKRQHHEGNTL
jgi:hypothetical protein